MGQSGNVVATRFPLRKADPSLFRSPAGMIRNSPDNAEPAGVIDKTEPSDDAGSEMKALMRADLVSAMKAGRTAETKLLRALVAAIDNAEAPPLDPDRKAADQHQFRDGSAEIRRLGLDGAAVRAILEAEMHDRESAAAEMDRLNRQDRAAALRAEALLVRRYLA
ncbi:MAG: hypothetical protein WDZ83_19435 [Rhizobiaceae bacterium]